MVETAQRESQAILEHYRNIFSDTYGVTKKVYFFVFLLVFTTAFVFAMYTDHTWEDWYITYRTSKNFATGYGLVFTPGERVHSFTSPLGTLIPALLNVVTGNVSDALVLWLYRVVNCCLLAISSLMILKIAENAKMFLYSTAILLALFAVDARIVEFSIDGMETALMVFFLVSTIYTLSAPSRQFVIKLGVFWGGLMWSRPDSFVYISGLVFGYLIFKPISPNYSSRVDLLKKFAIAAVVAAAVYLPWIYWTFYYYGTPIPHTIVAKGLLIPRPSLLDIIIKFIKFPVAITGGASSITHTFMPPYFTFGGWSYKMEVLAEGLSIMCALYWCIPGGRALGRALSFAVFCGHFYLSHIAAYVAPWYVPNVTILSILVLGSILQHLAEYLVETKDYFVVRRRALLGKGLYIFGFSIVLSSLLMTLAVGYQLHIQQDIIETGNRKRIGLWLSEHAHSPRDTVFLECLGYIGFFSQLKMYDFPGMSSPEVVDARRKLTTNAFGPLIAYLQPDWLVLRPQEVKAIQLKLPDLLATNYQGVAVFDVTEQLNSHRFLPGRPWLQFDSVFIVYKRL